MSIFSTIESKVVGGIHAIVADVEKGEQFLVLEVGKFKTYIQAHPSLGQDLQMLFGPAVTLLKNEAIAIENEVKSGGGSTEQILAAVWSGFKDIIPKVASSIASQANNPVNALTIVANAAQAILGAAGV